MNTFGFWVQNLRKNSELDLRTTAYISKIHFTTIGRIEKGQNDPTLDTVIKITNALNGDPFNLYNYLTGETALSPLPLEDYNPIFPTEKDCRLFVKLLFERPKTTAEFIADLLNKIIEKNKYPYLQNTNITGENKWLWENRENLNPEQKWLLELIHSPIYSANDIHKFLLGFPLQHYEKIIFTPMLIYPTDSNPLLSLSVYKQNAFMVFDDLINYFFYYRSGRDEVDIDVETIQDAKRKEKIQQIVDKFFGLSQISDMKLSDILLLDKSVCKNKAFFMMAWNVANEEILFGSKIHDFYTIRLLVTLSRHLAVESIEINWLDDLRKLF